MDIPNEIDGNSWVCSKRCRAVDRVVNIRTIDTFGAGKLKILLFYLLCTKYQLYMMTAYKL